MLGISHTYPAVTSNQLPFPFPKPKPANVPMINEPGFPDLRACMLMLIRDIPAAQSVTVVDHFYVVYLIDRPEFRARDLRPGSEFISHAAIISAALFLFLVCLLWSLVLWGSSGAGVYHKMAINHLIECRNELGIRLAAKKLQLFPNFLLVSSLFLSAVWLWHLILAHNYAVCIVPRTMDTKDMFALIIRLGHCTYKLILSCFKCQWASGPVRCPLCPRPSVPCALSSFPAGGSAKLIECCRQCRLRDFYFRTRRWQRCQRTRPKQWPSRQARFAIFRLGFHFFFSVSVGFDETIAAQWVLSGFPTRSGLVSGPEPIISIKPQRRRQFLWLCRCLRWALAEGLAENVHIIIAENRRDPESEIRDLSSKIGGPLPLISASHKWSYRNLGPENRPWSYHISLEIARSQDLPINAAESIGGGVGQWPCGYSLWSPYSRAV